MSTQEEHNVLVLDMSTLRFLMAASRAAVRATTQSGQVLAVVHPRIGESRSDIAFRAMDKALQTGTALWVDPTNPRGRRELRLALYNPLSGDISYGALPNTCTFSGASELELDRDGTPGVVRGAAGTRELEVSRQTMSETSRSVTELTRIIAGHTSA
jgi:hypothetical protein